MTVTVEKEYQRLIFWVAEISGDIALIVEVRSIEESGKVLTFIYL